MVLRFRYSMWDGTQELPPLEADDVLENLTDDLMNFGDLQHALRNLLQRGMRDPMGQRMQGLRDLLQQLRQQRRQTLDKYNLSSAFDDLKKRLNDIVQREKDTIQRRLEDAAQGQDGQPQNGRPQNGDGQPDGAEQSSNEAGQDGQDGAEGSEGAEGESG